MFDFFTKLSEKFASLTGKIKNSSKKGSKSVSEAAKPTLEKARLTDKFASKFARFSLKPLGKNEQKKLKEVLVRAFPKELESDVLAVFRLLPHPGVRSGGSHIGSGYYECESLKFTLPSGEQVELPQRIFLYGAPHLEALTPNQRLICHCIYTRNPDGYVREHHIRELLRCELPAFAMPYVLMLSGDYVKEILDAINQELDEKDTEPLKAFCRQNLQTFLYIYARMTAYWSCFYRWDFYKFDSYIGKKLFKNHLGYTPSMEKLRKKHRRP